MLGSTVYYFNCLFKSHQEMLPFVGELLPPPVYIYTDEERNGQAKTKMPSLNQPIRVNYITMMIQ